MLSQRQFLRRFFRGLWQRRGRMRGSLGLSTSKGERDLGNDRAKARARFWDAVHEGRSEAEAQCSKREPRHAEE